MKIVCLVTAMTALGAVGTVSAASWVRLPQSGAKPVELISRQIPGTTVHSSSGITSAAALIAEDPMEISQLQSGKGHATVQLRNQQLVDTVSFVNNGAAGNVTITGSKDNKNWEPLTQASFTASDRLIYTQFAGAQARYIRLDFSTIKGGSIASLNATGAAKTHGLDLKNAPPNSKATAINLASTLGGAKPVYLHPTPTNLGEPESEQNVFKFPQTAEKHRTIVYDLGASRVLKTFSSSYTARPVRVEVFTFESLPEQKDWRGKLTLDPEVFAQTAPVVAGVDQRGLGRIELSPKQPVVARYVALRFEPLGSDTADVTTEISNFVASLLTGQAAPKQVNTSGSGFSTFAIDISADVDSSAFQEALANLLGAFGASGGEGVIPIGEPQNEQQRLAVEQFAQEAALLGYSIFGSSAYANRGGGLGPNNDSPGTTQMPVIGSVNVVRGPGGNVTQVEVDVTTPDPGQVSP